jgi:tRNA G18 (ribose-2'-O)-methylase SpoU
MFRIEKISSFDFPELAPYRTMRRSVEHEKQGIFVAEGEKVVRRLLESRFPVVSVVLPEKCLEDFRPLLEARPEQIVVYLAERKFLETLTGVSLFQGVLAIGKIPLPASLAEILARSPRPQLFVAVDALTNAENLGALVRNCVAFGAQALLVGETSSSPFLRRAVRNSMGTIFQLPVIETTSLVAALQTLREKKHPLHRRASAHGQKISFSGGFFRRLLPRFRQRRRRNFQSCFGKLRRSRGDSHVADGGFAQRRGSGGGFSLRSATAKKQKLLDRIRRILRIEIQLC